MRLIRLAYLIVWMLPIFSMAQCPVLYDFYGNPTTEPYWFTCSGGNYTLNLQSPNNIGNWSVDWGDGSSVQTGNSLVPPAFISHFYTSDVDTFIVTFTEIASGCEIVGVLVMEEATSASIQIPVGGLTQACAPHPLDFINSSTNTSQTTTFTWDFGDGSPTETYDYTNLGETVTHTYEQGTVDCETVVTLTAQNYCNIVQGGSSQATFSPIRIWDLDDAAITASATLLCYPDTIVTFTNTTERNCLFQGNIFQRQEYWNFGDYWGTGQDSIIGWTPWPPTYPNTIAYPGIGVYEVMLIDSNYCGQDTTFTTIEIVPPPVAAISASDDTICAGETVVFYNESTGSANSWSWHFGTGQWLNLGGGNVSRTFNTPGTYLVQLAINIQGATPGCADTASVTVVVLPAPDAIINIDNPAACDELTVNFTDGSTGSIAQWQWLLPTGQLSTNQNPPTQVLSTPGVHNVTLTVTSPNGCANSTTEQVNVFISPIVGFAPQNVCQGESAIFMDQSISSPGDPIISWDWIIDGTSYSGPIVNHVFNSTGTFDISLEVATANCSSNDAWVITVDPSPDAAFTTNQTEGCGPLQIQFQNESIGAYGYFWDFGDGTNSIEENPVHVYNNFTTGQITFDAMLVALTEFGCSDTTYETIIVNPGAVALFTANTLPGCAPFDATFTNQSAGAVSYQWNFGDGSPVSNEVNPTHTYVNQGLFVENFQVQLIAYSASGCNDTTYTTITAYPEPNFGFNISPQTTCSPVAVQFPNIVGAVILDWNFGDNTVGSGQAPSHVYINNTADPITYTTQLIAISPFGCVDTSYADILVNPGPTADFVPNITEGCGPLEVTFENLSINGDEFLWSYGDNTTSQNSDVLHTHVFENTTASPINFTVNLLVETFEGCTSTLSETITVFPEPNFDFDILSQNTCSPVSIQFPNVVGAVTLDWNFGDNTVGFGQAPYHTYVNETSEPITYTAELIAVSQFGCVDTAYADIIVNQEPNAEFTASVTEGCGPLQVTFENLSVNGDQYFWSYGDNTTSQVSDDVHIHVFENNTAAPINYTVSLLVETDEGCTSSVNQIITVFPEPNFGFEIFPQATCSPVAIQFPNVPGAAQLNWNFGDNTIGVGQAPYHSFVNNTSEPVIYTVQLVAISSFGCADTAYADVLVNPQPIAQFMPNTLEGCGPLEVTFENLSIYGDEFVWTYGDNTSSQVSDSLHTHVFENTSSDPINYTVTLLAETFEGCSSSSTQIITVYPQVVADFSIPEAVCESEQISFQNNSVNASTYFWEFGDGFVGVVASPTHNYNTNSAMPETFVVLLTATSQYGCEAIATDSIVINPLPEAIFTVSEFNGCAPFAANFINGSTNAVQYEWSYGNTGFSNNADLEHEYVFQNNGNNAQQHNVLLTAISEFGCQSTANQIVTVFPAMEASFEVSPDGCTSFSPTFVNTSQGAINFLWDFGNGFQMNGPNPSQTYVNTGEEDETFIVSLIAESQFGCVDSAMHEVVVHPLPVMSFNIDSISPCNPSEVFISNSSTGATSFDWKYGDGTSSFTTDENHSHIFYNASNQLVSYPITLTGTTIYGCVDSLTIPVEIWPALLAVFEADTIGCSPLEVTMLNQTQGAIIFDWYLDGVPFSDLNSPTYTFVNETNNDLNYEVMLVAESYTGCTDTLTKNFTVLATPQAFFIADPEEQMYPNATVNLYNNSISGAATYAWTFGDGTGSSEQHPGSVTYGTWGVYTISLTVDNGVCSDIYTRDITIDVPLPVADFIGEEQGCSPVTVDFINTSEYGVYFFWQFGDGMTSNAENPSHTYFAPGVYTVTLSVIGPGGDEDIMVKEEFIEVYPQAVAFFTANPTNVVVPSQPVYFFNLSVNADTYYWEFGDGSTSEEENPFHQYMDPGVYGVSLIVNNIYNCPDTFNIEDAIIAEGGGSLKFPNAFTPSSTGSTGGYFDLNANNFNNDIFFPLYKGVDEYQLMVFNRWGELIFESREVNRGWDGYYRGDLCQQDVYVWKVRAKFSDGTQRTMAGDVTLIR